MSSYESVLEHISHSICFSTFCAFVIFVIVILGWLGMITSTQGANAFSIVAGAFVIYSVHKFMNSK